MAHSNRKYKDRLFHKLFGNPENKDNLLSLYNALNNTSYTNAEDLEINTIDDVLFMNMKNDVSCILDNQMMISEQQSTFNPNMPLRGLLYFSQLYEKYIAANQINIYRKKLQSIPSPRYFVLYNGSDDIPEVTQLKLSDAFIHPITDGSYEWTATMININEGHNPNILSACKTLADYSHLTSLIQQYREKGLLLDKAVLAAVNLCIKEGVLADFLTQHKAEVIGMVLTEFNEEEVMQDLREEAIEDGIKIGYKEGQEDGLKALVSSLKKYITSPEDILFAVRENAIYGQITISDIQKYL